MLSFESFVSNLTWNNQSNIKVTRHYVYVKGYLSKHYCDITRVKKTDKVLSLKEKLDRTKSIHTVAGG